MYADVENSCQTDAKVSHAIGHVSESFFSYSSGDPMIVFAGGLPRSSYSSKHTVSCFCENEHTIEGTRHVAFDFTTAVIDFFTIDQVSHDGCKFDKRDSATNHLFYLVRDDPQALVVLLSEEIVVIDLVTDNWPMYHLPYLSSVHASPVICTTLVSHVHHEFYEKLLKDAALQFEDYSDRVGRLSGLISTVRLMIDV